MVQRSIPSSTVRVCPPPEFCSRQTSCPLQMEDKTYKIWGSGWCPIESTSSYIAWVKLTHSQRPHHLYLPSDLTLVSSTWNIICLTQTLSASFAPHSAKKLQEGHVVWTSTNLERHLVSRIGIPTKIGNIWRERRVGPILMPPRFWPSHRRQAAKGMLREKLHCRSDLVTIERIDAILQPPAWDSLPDYSLFEAWIVLNCLFPGPLCSRSL